ncbi:MAG: lipoprotein ABC transporter ATP-binding protein [Proteobacteria bacterium]|nr:MAG: lipoprotein ABC transporter ATP-binding protein [Pseudomonadota bacterium]
MSNDILLQSTDLCKYYHSGDSNIAALDHVDFQLERGAFTVLSGRSGSGKTTLLNMIGLLDSPDKGALQIAGEDVLALSSAARANFRLQRIGFVFQAYNLIRVLSAQENVAYVLQLRGMPKQERLVIANRWLAEVGLEGLEHRRPDQLSGGQQQRVAVARALASEPALVLADEPTANLDSQHGESLMALMRELNERCGMTFLIASHDPVAMAAAKQSVYMQDGKIIACDDV